MDRREEARARRQDAAAVATCVTFLAALGATSLGVRAWLAQRAPRASADASVEIVSVDTTTSAESDEPATTSTKESAAPASGAAPKRPYNVVLLTIDTLRFDLGFAGYPRPVSPHLDAFAARSTVFERAYALASYTPKSLGPMLIGRYASETLRDREHYTTFYPGNVFLAERVRGAGGRTAAANCHLYFSWKFGMDQGFDVWDTTTMPPGMTDSDPRVTSDKLSDRAIRLLERIAAQDAAPDGAPAPPFFAWFHYIDPHAPYVHHEGAPPFATMDGGPRARAVYDEEVWFTDAQVGRVLAWIAEQRWAAETAIIVTADHGEAFGEKGHWKHGREVWEPLVRVPLLVHVPGASPQRVPVKRSHIDLVPTVLDLMAIPAGEGELRGASLLADVFAPDGEPLEERDVLVDMPEGPFNEARRAIVTGRSPGLKLVDFGGARRELYDLAEDPWENRPLPLTGERFLEAREAYERMTKRLRVTAP